MKVLLTDGNFRHTLAAVRSFGRRGVDVSVISHLRPSLGFFSRYCRERILGPDPERDSGFASFIRDLTGRARYDVLLPISLAAVMQVSRIRNDLAPHVRVPLAPSESLEIAAHKDRTIQCAGSLGIPVPGTFYPKGEKDAEDIGRIITYPAVVKGSHVSYVRYANSPGELLRCYRPVARDSPVIQEYVRGRGYGFFALYNHGEARAIFMHRRLREYPVTGGASSLAESIRDEGLSALGSTLLDSLKWHGVAMAEFKREEETGKFVLMELNPKFWGSLELAIVAGVDFPWLACRMAMEGEIDPVLSYREGVKFRWLLPLDLFHAVTNPRAIPRFLADFADGSIHSDLDYRDPLPNLMQAGMTVAEACIRLKEGRFWRPHGTPCL
jgi:predicted ATP-grasp superfamily ATP-dependent carboligase